MFIKIPYFTLFSFEGVCSNSRHPGHRRVWRGGSEQHLMTPLRDAAAAAADEFRDPLFLMTLSMISLTFAGHAPPKIGPKHQFEKKKPLRERSALAQYF